jgi:hypothetical protein
MSNKEYSLFNVFIVALLFILFLGSFLLDAGEGTMSCQVLKATGKECAACGLSRDFVNFGQLKFDSPINSQSIYVFFWFLSQLLFRLFVNCFPTQVTPKLMKYDLTISVITALTVFLPFWF